MNIVINHMYSFNKRLESIISLIYGFLAFMVLGPYFFWYSSPSLFRGLSLFVLLLSVIYLLFKGDINKKALIFTGFFLVSFFFRQFSYIGFTPWFSVMVLISISFLMMGPVLWRRIFIVFLNIYVVVLVPGILMYVLIAIGVQLNWVPIESMHPFKASSGLYYRQYPGMVILSNQIFPFNTGELFRFSAVFDEPGVVGTVSAFLLAATKFNIKSLRGCILLVSGILSFSFAFIVLCFIYLVIRRFLYLLVVFVCLAGVTGLVSENLKNNELLERYLYAKIQGAIIDINSVDNRTNDEFEYKYNNFLTSKAVFFGARSIDVKREAGSSYKHLIYMYGLLGFVIILFFYGICMVFLVKKNNIKDSFLFYIFMMVSIYQRPEVDSFWYLVVFIGGLAFLGSMQPALAQFNECNTKSIGCWDCNSSHKMC